MIIEIKTIVRFKIWNDVKLEIEKSNVVWINKTLKNLNVQIAGI